MNPYLLLSSATCALCTCLALAALLDAEARGEPGRRCTIISTAASISAIATATFLILAALFP